MVLLVWPREAESEREASGRETESGFRCLLPAPNPCRESWGVGGGVDRWKLGGRLDVQQTGRSSALPLSGLGVRQVISAVCTPVSSTVRRG